MTSALRLHHAGYVVASIASSVQGFLTSLHATWDEQIFEDPLQRVKVTFLTVDPGAAQIELVEPVGDQSPVRRFLEDKGGGLHHLCYETGDLEGEIASFRARRAGLVITKPQPAVAFGGRRIAWVVTRESLVVEFLENPVLRSLPE